VSPKRLLRRYEAAIALLPKLRLGLALRQRFREGYGVRDLGADVMAGVVVGIVALPLAMALAIGSGVPPQHGLYTAIIAGGVIALLGGSRTQVSGPTAAFVVILAPIAAVHGLGGLLVATVMAGIILIAMGVARMGRLIEFIPHPVTTGFTAGIGVVLATLQLKDLLGLTLASNPEHFADRVEAYALAWDTTRLPEVTIAATTLLVLMVWPRLTKKIPAPLVALLVGTGLSLLLPMLLGDSWVVATIGGRFSYREAGVTHAGIPPWPPTPVLPWTLAGGDGKPLVLDVALLRTLAPSAFAIAMLGAIESLLCAVVSDGMAGTKHDPDVELIAQGVGNLVAPFFGGIAATGAIARTATNVRAGARSPIAAFVHALVVLAGVVLLAGWLAYLPMASLAAVLLIVAWNMAEVKHFLHVLRVAPRSDALVLVVCFLCTVVFDMVVAVSVGVVLAALLFMRRMAEISHARLVGGGEAESVTGLPANVLLYEIQGPLFFGAAQKAISTIEAVSSSGKVRTVILHMGAVPIMDVTGLVALESAIAKLRKAKAFVILSGVQAQPRGVLARAGLVDDGDRLAICETLNEAIERAKGRPRTSMEMPAVT
jgi:sulfate permease, SulP family